MFIIHVNNTESINVSSHVEILKEVFGHLNHTLQDCFQYYQVCKVLLCMSRFISAMQEQNNLILETVSDNIIIQSNVALNI